MTSKTRLILFLVLVTLFLAVAPLLVFYSLGYRVDFRQGEIVATGGIYIRVLPNEANIIIDDKISDKTGIFSNSLFIQNLSPKNHNVLIKKEGYYDYQKNLLVKENEVTKLENVILFSKDVFFEILDDATQFALLKKKPLERFVVGNNNLYYSESEKNSQLTNLQKNTPVLKSIIAFKVSNNNIIWLGLDGFLKISDLDGKNTQKLNQTAFKINTKKFYQLEIFSQNIFLKEGNNLLLFDQEKKIFQDFYNPIKDLKVSPDGQKIIYFNDNEIFIYYLNQNLLRQFTDDGKNNALLQKSSDLPAEAEKIIDCSWLNNDYIICNSTNKILISETDVRGNVNSISLPETLSLTNGKVISIIKPAIFFDQRNKILYILTQNQLIFSDKLLP